MKAIPILVGILAVAAITTAEVVERSSNLPGITIIRPDGRRSTPEGRANAARSPRTLGLMPVDPKVQFQGPADVEDGGSAVYELSVTNEGTDPFGGPFTVELEFSEGFASAVVDGQGWSCTLSATNGTCDWPTALLPGETTGTATFTVDVIPPYGDETGCDPERSPCVFFRGTIAGFHSAAAFSAVAVGGNAPPLARDDAVFTGAVPAPIDVDVLGNDFDELFSFLGVSIAEPPANGTATVDPATRHILYTPGPAYSGSDAFRYRITDLSGATDTAVVTVRQLQGGISLSGPLFNIGQVEPGRIAMLAGSVSNTTGVDLIGTTTLHPLDPAEIPGVLSGTGYDPAQAVFDPTVFLPGDGGFFFLPATTDFPLFPMVRPKTPIGVVWLARLRLTMHPGGSPDAIVQAETVLVARSGSPTDVRVHIRDDADSVPMDLPAMLHPLVNDDSVAGETLTVSSLWMSDPFEMGEFTQGNLEFAEPTNGGLPFRAVRFTPHAGFQGTTSFWYAASEIVDGSFGRYDFAEFIVTVGGQPSRRLTVVKSGTGTGHVTSAPAGIDCGATCQATYAGGTDVVLTAIPDGGFAFAGWSGDPDCSDGTVRMDADKTCTATFSARPDLVTLLVLAPFLTSPGIQIQVVVTTWNVSGNPAGASTTRIYLSRDTILDPSDVAIGAFGVPALGAGNINLQFPTASIPPNATGQYYVIASADANGDVAETNEANNARASLWRLRVIF